MIKLYELWTIYDKFIGLFSSIELAEEYRKKFNDDQYQDGICKAPIEAIIDPIYPE